MNTTPSGLKLGSSKYCSGCAAQLHVSAPVCPKCGSPQGGITQRSPTSGAPKERVIAGLLALFVGGFGIHKFYLGRNGTGILYLVFFWTFIPAIIAFFEALGFFFMTDENFHAKYA